MTTTRTHFTFRVATLPPRPPTPPPAAGIRCTATSQRARPRRPRTFIAACLLHCRPALTWILLADACQRHLCTAERGRVGNRPWPRFLDASIPTCVIHVVDFHDVDQWLQPEKYDGRLKCHVINDNAGYSVFPDEYFDFCFSFGCSVTTCFRRHSGV